MIVIEFAYDVSNSGRGFMPMVNGTKRLPSVRVYQAVYYNPVGIRIDSTSDNRIILGNANGRVYQQNTGEH